MAYAISVLFDGIAKDYVRHQWDKLCAANLSRSMIDLDYVPHVTLAVYEKLDPERTCAELDPVFADRGALDFALGEVATFGAESGAVYLSLEESEELRHLHASVVAAVSGDCHPHYRAKVWVPHCTLATDLEDTKLAAAIQAVEEGSQTMDGIFSKAELVEFRPVRRIKCWPLRLR